MTDDSLPTFIRHLLLPLSFSHPVREVTLVQTHISYVLLAGDFVYKFKKPMDFGFLDFSTLEKRKYCCEQELILNRRLCPSIYFGLVSVNQEADGTLGLFEPAGPDGPGGADGFGGPGRAIEYGVKMVRMPEERMMGNIIRRGELTRKMIDEIISILAPFYEVAASGSDIDRYGSVEAVGENVWENLQQCEQYVGCASLSPEEYEHIGGYIDRFLQRGDLFASRISAGKIRDCHGDLHSANICLADEVYIYDCIEFNHRFRYSDVASDVAFLAMDLDFFGLEESSDYFIERFMDVSGDDGLFAMLNFYKCYRATVRGKIGLLTAHEPEVDDETRSKALNQATRYFVLAQRYADNG